MKLTKYELEMRLNNFCAAMDISHPSWNTAVIVNKVNQYYFTGTVQDGILFIKNDRNYAYFVRKSFDRAVSESPLENIYPMRSYRDASEKIGNTCGNAFIEGEVMPVAMLERIRRHFDFQTVSSLDGVLNQVRAVKSEYELFWMKKSGQAHNAVLLESVPKILREGMSEAQFFGDLTAELFRYGFQGISRFSRFQTEMINGQVAFGENSLQPTNFDGPGGSLGSSPATPVAASHDRFLKKGDLVFVDIGFGINGYHSDKTQVFIFGSEVPENVRKAHKFCIDIQLKVASRLVPGAVPADIYNEIMGEISDEDKINFMGFGKNTVKFLGHGIGLNVDEQPVIAHGFNQPLKENMVIAVEPKKGIAGVGMVGVEETFLVTKNGGICISGGAREIIPCF